MSRTEDELLQIPIVGDNDNSASLDIIRLDNHDVMFVISDRGAIQHRVVVRVSLGDCVKIAKFIVGIKDSPSGEDDGES